MSKISDGRLRSSLTLWTMLFAFVPLTANAQGASPVTPGVGSILQQIPPATPAAPSSPETGLRLERDAGVTPLPSIPFEVKAIQITGNALFDTSILHALVADGEGQTLNLAQLQELADRITAHYQRQGYPLARAIIPMQMIRAGMVKMEIIEARYGQIRLDNRSQVNNVLLQDALTTLQSGQPISQAGLDPVLLRLSDVPGVALSATLKPGEAVGTADLVVQTDAGPAVSGNVVLDNYGNRYTGRARASFTVNFINPLHHGDVLSVSGLTSGSGLNYGRIAYEALLNGQGTRLGGSYSALRYVLGGPLASLRAHGTAEMASLFAKHPLVRSRDANLYGQIQYDRLQLREHIDASAIRTDRSLSNWTASLSGDTRDALLSGGVNTWNVGWTTGDAGFDDAQAQLADAATARTEGGFSKWNASLSRLQGLSAKSALYLSFSGQWADGNLDPSKKMIAGGPYTVRAYDMGVVSGDSGYLASAEFRYDLGSAWQGRWQAVAFIDSAHVTINKNVWAAGTNSATLSGAGAGLNWAGPEQWSARVYIAAPLGSTPALVGSTASTRAWVEISRSF